MSSYGQQPELNHGSSETAFVPHRDSIDDAKVAQPDDDENNQSSPVGSDRREKRHRNKPSLSCRTCTTKKTKCDRTRPVCFACQKRKSECHYSQVADLIEESHRVQGIDSPRKRQKFDQPAHDSHSSPIASADRKHFVQDLPATRLPSLPSIIPEDFRPVDRTPSRSSSGSAPSLLSNLPFSHPTVSNLFKVEVSLQPPDRFRILFPWPVSLKCSRRYFSTYIYIRKCSHVLFLYLEHRSFH